MKFFFEQEEEDTKPSEDKEFFFMLKEAGIVQQPGDKPQDISADAVMKQVSTKLVAVEYGTYQDNYAVHVTPVHPRKNLDESKVEDAIRQLILVMHEYVPQTLQVKIYPPRADWQMKVISFVIEGGATAWNFDVAEFESSGIPKIQMAMEKVIMK